MYKYILEHEKSVLEQLNNTNKSIDYEELLKYHNNQILWIQHERLIHLIITIFTALLFLLFGAIMLFFNNFITDILFLMISIVMVFYIVHYCRLENSVQKWYTISNNIRDKIKERSKKND